MSNSTGISNPGIIFILLTPGFPYFNVQAALLCTDREEENVAETDLVVVVVMDSTNEHNYHQVKW